LVEFAGRIIGNVQQLISGSGIESFGRDKGETSFAWLHDYFIPY
jgi:hypothetical protein